MLGMLVLALGIYFAVSRERVDDKVEAIMKERNFAIEEDEIVKVTITSKDGKLNTITRDEDLWLVNGKRMNNNQVFLLTEALTRIKMESIPPQKANENIIKTIGRIGILVRVYGKNDEILRSYYVGGVPQSERGTYYLMEGYTQPYLMQIPGMEGSTRGRFVKRDTDWLDRAMFRYPKKDIKYISLKYPKSKNSSFQLEKKGGSFEVKPLFNFTPKIDKEINQRSTEDYMEGYYKGFFTEAFVNDFFLKDSVITHMTPFLEMRIVNEQSDTTSLDLYNYNEIFNTDGDALGPGDISRLVERYYVNVNKGESFMLTQHVLAKKYLWAYDYFFK